MGIPFQRHWTCRLPTPISLAMLRRLLACLALLTGLAAAGAPAQAAVAVSSASRMEASAAEGAATRDQAAAAPAKRAVPRKVASAPAAGPLLRTIFRVPTVQLGGDRARE